MMNLIRFFLQDLQSYWKDINIKWNIVDEKWKDKVKDIFEKEFWNDWEEEMPKFLKSLENLSNIIEQALSNTNL